VYRSNVSINEINSATHFDLTDMPYHGGSTLSSGALPKWDLFDGAFMIKRCSINEYGHQLTDAVNEELACLFCKALGIPAAQYRLVYIKYKDTETGDTIEAQAALTKIFGDLVHYRDVRRRMMLGEGTDAYLDFSEKFDIQPALNDLLFLDYITNQSDRHSKNLGLVGNQMSPVFDSGACLFHDILDSELSESYFDKVPIHKTFGKRLDAQLIFALKHVHPGFSFVFNEAFIYARFLDSLDCVKHYYSTKRLTFIKSLVKGRLKHVGRFFAEAQSFRNSVG